MSNTSNLPKRGFVRTLIYEIRDWAGHLSLLLLTTALAYWRKIHNARSEQLGDRRIRWSLMRYGGVGMEVLDELGTIKATPD